MKIIIEYNGKVYEGGEDIERSMEETFQEVYSNFERLNKMTLRLSDGSQIIFGKEAMQRAVIRLVP